MGDGQTQVSNGKVAAEDAAVAVPAWSRSSLAERYTVVETGAVRRLGRTAEGIEVYEGDLLRAAIVFDEETGAPLLTQLYDGDGGLFRYSAMLDFDLGDRRAELGGELHHRPRVGVQKHAVLHQALGATRMDSVVSSPARRIRASTSVPMRSSLR